MTLNCTSLAIAIVALCATNLEAQCADGSPPPCASAAPRVAARDTRRAPDPNLIAILPYRVTTTDTLLGEGFAELLATEFTGEGAPRAVDMATVLSAWRRAGGGLRTPLPRAKALEVAREVGAGIVSEGSIVGLGRQITITTTLVTVPDGAARGSPTRVTTAADSLDVALRLAATGLLATVGGQQRSIEGARFTESAEAMRLYLHGLAAWRRGRLRDAMLAFDAALALDSSFAQAAFRGYIGSSWGLSAGQPGQRYTNLAFAFRDRLSPRERAILEAVLGPSYPATRTIDERHAARERAVQSYPDSPEALYFRGDYWYHYGAPVDPINHLARAKAVFERAAAVDTQATILRHLIEVGIRLRDTVLLRRVAPAYARMEDPGRWAGLWITAAASGDEAQLARLRRRVEADSTQGSQWPLGSALSADVRASLLDEMIDRWTGALRPSPFRDVLTTWAGVTAAVRGRPAAAQSRWMQIRSREAMIDLVPLLLDMSGAGRGLAAEAAAQRLEESTKRDSLSNLACHLAAWKVAVGRATTVDPRRFARVPHCANAIAALLVARAPGDTGLAVLARLDSLERNSVNTALIGYETALLARAWEHVGQPQRALGAIRYRAHGLGGPDAVWTYADEGRLAEIVGDSASAVSAYSRWLEITRDAEPIWQPKRDSVAAALARLTKRSTP